MQPLGWNPLDAEKFGWNKVKYAFE